MTTAGDGKAPYESRGDGEKSRKRQCRPEIEEEPQDVSQEAGRINSSGVPDQRVMSASTSVTVGIPELEQMLKQRTFTRSEIQRLTVLLHSRACDNANVESDATVVPITPTPLPQHPKTIENLPDDVLLKVFIRLVARQLAQMRSVSKHWNFLLSQPSFIKSHLHRSIHNNNQILVVFYNNNAPRINRKVFTPYLSRSPPIELINFISIPRVQPGSGHTYRMLKIIGSVHGLICSRYDRTIHIWNPSLRAVSTLPPYTFPYCGCYEVFLRFGYDPETDDYKVVKITGLRDREDQASSSDEEDEDGVPSFHYVITKWLEVEIYSMRTGSWKIITERFPSHITRMFNKDEVCVDGHDGRIHWVGHTNEKRDSEVIVAFNLSSETFREMALPDTILNYDRSNTLGVLGGKLCVMSRDGEFEIDVWVMEEYGVAESWVKRHIFRFSHDHDAFSGFTSHNEFLFEDAKDRLVLYDRSAYKNGVIILEKCPRGKCNTDRIVEYVDSLVWVAPPM